MSKALDFLIQARPGAMQSYFAFLKQAGSHLDKKTAALISVITKVHSRTANGVRQYVPRALAAGASADEVIDALLMAMPALGFSKIVWAIDILLEMDLPEFRKFATVDKTEATTTQWLPIANADTIADNDHLFVRGGKHSCYIVRQGTEYRVYDAHCPHKGNLIPETGAVQGKLTCPFHEWQFDLKTGKCLSGGATPLKVLAAKVEDGKIWLNT